MKNSDYSNWFFDFEVVSMKKGEGNFKLKELTELEKIFSLYRPFWREWRAYKHSGLSKVDLYVLSSLIKNEFKLKSSSRNLLYQRIDIINNVKQKLLSTYLDYQDWAIVKFQFMLINRNEGYELDSMYSTSISELSIEPELKAILLRFKFNTLQNLFESHSDKDFRAADLFGHILLFKKTDTLLKNNRDKPNVQLKR